MGVSHALQPLSRTDQVFGLVNWVLKVRIWVRPMMMIYYDEVALCSFDYVVLAFPFYAATWGV